MNDISSYVSNFVARLGSGLFYKEPLSEAEKQGHVIVANILQKAIASPEIMGSLSVDFLNKAVSLQAELAALKEQLNPTKKEEPAKKPTAQAVNKTVNAIRKNSGVQKQDSKPEKK